MAFTLDQTDSYSWPVELEVAGDGGKFERHSFDIRFRRLTQSRIDALAEAGRTGDQTDRDTCKELITGWNGIDQGGDSLPFSQGALDRLLDIAGAPQAIILAWAESLQGARRKN
mgnify:CR=1 FL=1